ncbi:hypothetical protein [Flavobacterium capsici]|uniref:Uncharacterized protein n=1 Tax=Flavobacterium capsici TaxID=3075618 RepID=A0AA96J2C2_9FLAO|nr:MULTISPECIES: hypothetical protein [unclassified Flavobacterium]WNM18945.1 hypothetical protein RN608_13140 [Flavobacterium sp. PMR2A8]WNM22995.1 hypothetical protein RN605_06440 [Flavobacterium sp. PMTSA4]
MVNLVVFLAYSLIYIELISFVAGIYYFKKFKDSYWKWFIYYLGLISLLGFFQLHVIIEYFEEYNNYFGSYLIIPIEFMFFFWLYAYKSLKKKNLFWVFSFLYLLSFAMHSFIKKEISSFYSFNYVIGAFLLGILVFLEYMKQIKSDDIIKFKENMMFYINLGVSILYIGTLPFFSFYGIIIKDLDLRMNYYLFFLIVNNFMYILFTLAFIWSKPNTY